jgi:putative tricarboxylic transport membrane protein
MVAAAPGITDAQKSAIQSDIEKMAKSESWQKTLKDKGWADTYLAGDAFVEQLKKDTDDTTAILKDIGLVK